MTLYHFYCFYKDSIMRYEEQMTAIGDAIGEAFGTLKEKIDGSRTIAEHHYIKSISNRFISAALPESNVWITSMILDNTCLILVDPI